MKKKREVKLAFSRFFFGELRQACSKQGAPDTRDEKRSRKIRACLALLARFALAFQKKTTLVMQDKKSLGKLKATMLKKIILTKSCLLLRYKVHVNASQKLLIFSYIIEMLSSD